MRQQRYPSGHLPRVIFHRTQFVLGEALDSMKVLLALNYSQVMIKIKKNEFCLPFHHDRGGYVIKNQLVVTLF